MAPSGDPHDYASVTDTKCGEQRAWLDWSDGEMNPDYEKYKIIKYGRSKGTTILRTALLMPT